MIDISKLTEADKQREVKYTTDYCWEYGRITSWNERFVFVRYHLKAFRNGTRLSRYGTTSEATLPEDLEFV